MTNCIYNEGEYIQGKEQNRLESLDLHDTLIRDEVGQLKMNEEMDRHDCI